MKTAFFGTPAIGVQALRALRETTELVGAVCQPDRPAGRGLKVAQCPIKVAASEMGLEVYQPTRVRDGALQAWLLDREVDAAIVFAYGRILPREVLDAPRLGCINLHASLLPKYRGAAPIQWAIAQGERETGISLMKMDVGLDTGPVYTRRSLPIASDATAGQLTEQLAALAVQVIREDLPLVFAGAAATPQVEAEATLAPLIVREHLELDFTLPAEVLARRVRAFAPTPAAFCFADGKRVKLLQVKVIDFPPTDAQPGTIIAAQKELLLVQTGCGVLAIEAAQFEGKRLMSARDLINGRTLTQGQRLTPRPALKTSATT